jgi:hypothetical protein
MALGISRADAAEMIGSTDESLRKSFETIAKKAKTSRTAKSKATASGQ